MKKHLDKKIRDRNSTMAIDLERPKKPMFEDVMARSKSDRLKSDRRTSHTTASAVATTVVPKKRNKRTPTGLTPSRLRDAVGNDYLCIEAPKTGGGRAVITVPMAMRLQPGAIVAELCNAGARVPLNKEQAKELVEACLLSIPESAGLLAQRTGWHGAMFVEGAFNLNTGTRKVMPSKEVAEAANRGRGKAGTLDQWTERVAAPATRSVHLAFGLMVGFSASIARFGNLNEGAVFNFCGTSSTGKSTVLRAGKSIVGKTDILTTWDATARGLHELAAASSDLALVIDDLETMRAATGRKSHELSRALQTLTSSTSGSIASMARDRLPLLDWEFWALSSSPVPLNEYFRLENRDPTPGDRVRWIDINVPGPASGGIWADAGSSRHPSARSEAVTAACRENYGVAIKPWLRFLINRPHFKDEILAYRDEFVAAAAPNATDTDRRAALKFGVVYAGGRLAITAGLLPWAEDLPMVACTQLYKVYVSTSLHETAALATAASKLLAALADDVRVPHVEAANPTFEQEADYDGFCRGDAVYLKTDSVDARCGAHSQRLLGEIREAGASLPGEGKKATVQKRLVIDGVTVNKRMLPFNARLLRSTLRRLASAS